MNEDIKVHVVKYPDRTNLVMRYLDPMTNKQITRSTGTKKQREAEKAAAKWEAELQEGRYQKRSRMSWEEFRDCFEQDAMAGMNVNTAANYDSTFRAIEKYCPPKGIADLTTARVTAFVRELRKPYPLKLTPDVMKTRSEASIARHLRHLKAIARWAHRQGYLAKVPTFDMPKRSSGAQRMKGRPITTEEFERMLTATWKVVTKAKTSKALTQTDVAVVDSWKLLLRGLWASGLRLGEALALRWDQQPGAVTIHLDGKQSVLAFDAGSQKSGKVQLVPLAPEAVELLEPHAKSAGYVFSPRYVDGELLARRTDTIGKQISAIGKAAGVVVDPDSGKAASAHDLRRAFGYRWSRRIMPPQLQELMRHASVETTMTFYVGQNAKTTAAELWATLGNSSGNSENLEPSKNPKTPCF